MEEVSPHISENSHIEIYTIQKETLTYYFSLFKAKCIIIKCSASIMKSIWNPRHPLQIATFNSE